MTAAPAFSAVSPEGVFEPRFTRIKQSASRDAVGRFFNPRMPGAGWLKAKQGGWKIVPVVMDVQPRARA